MVQSPNNSVAWKASIGIGACLFIGSLYLFWQLTSKKPADSSSPKRRRSSRHDQRQMMKGGVISTSDDQHPSVPSTSSSSCDNYEVFLSFRGEDTRKGFTSHLYQALDDHGIRTFLDNEELERGQSLKPQLDGAINKSEVVIVVISESHATSKWCLNELLAIVQCHHKPVIIPVFYHVDPSDFRNQTGPFAEPFAKHEKTVGREKVKEWKEAMTTIANHSGYDLDHTADGNEAKVIKMVVRDVTKRVDKRKAHVGTNLPGMDSRKQDVLRMLNTGAEDVRMLGIWGTGGLGKTTLAETIYNELIGEFEFKCFIENVREKATKENSLISLQKYLISEISREKCDDMMSSGQAMEKVQRSLRNKRVLLVIDDADAVEQLDALVGREVDDLFGAGSRIVITTRVKDLLVGCNINNDMIYEPLPLNLDQSRLLFCHHAFRKDAPGKGYEKLTDDIVSKLGGHPLALKVTGAYMFGKRSEEIWRQMSKKLEGGSHDEKVDKCLRVSFDGLDVDDAKEIFLDICCFFIGKDVKEALYMWEAGGFKHSILAIDELENKSLLHIDGQSCKFQMHDVVRDMGRKIVYNKSKQTRGCSSRIWNQDESLNLLENSKLSTEAEGILVDYDRRKKVSLHTNCFTESSNLRLLCCGGADIEGSFETFPSKLNLLDWSQCDLEYLPDEMELRECAVLRLARSNFIQLSMERKVFLPKLGVLDLQRCEKLVSLPHDLSTTIPHLKRLILRDCWNLAGLPDSLCGLMELEVLDLYKCENVESLPEDLGDLKSLKVFILDGTRVFDLPTSIRGLGELTLFHWCPFVQEIEMIGSKGEEELERLINILIHDLKHLTHLKLPPIEHFVLKVLTGRSSQLLSQLRCLEFSLHFIIDDSPINYSSLVEEKKEVGGYYNTENLVVPPVGHDAGIVAPVLEFLSIRMLVDGPLTKLDTLPTMPSVVDLEISNWINCKCLWKVELEETSTTTSSPVPCLKKVCLESVSNIQTLPYLPSLEELSIHFCDGITRLWEPDDAPEKLKVLKVSCCPSLSWISTDDEYMMTTQVLHKLQELAVDDSLSTYLLDVQPVMPRLQKLDIVNWRVEGLGDHELLGYYNRAVPIIINWLKKLPRLSWLGICYFTSITSIRGPWHELPELETLEIYNAQSLEDYSLLEDNNAPPPKFKELVIKDSDSTSITKLPDLIHLKRLRIDGLGHLRVLPEMPNLPELEELVIEGCVRLKSLPRSWVEGMLHLHNLTRIRLAVCRELRATLPQKLYEKGLDIIGCQYVKIVDAPLDTIAQMEEDEDNDSNEEEEEETDDDGEQEDDDDDDGEEEEETYDVEEEEEE